MTRNERVTMRAAEILSETLARADAQGCAAMLLRTALDEAEQQIGGKPARNAVVMVEPLKALIQGHPIVIAPRGDDGPRITE